MELTSPAFESDQKIPLKYTCDGDDVSPPLDIKEIPKKTKSLVLIVDDPDAPTGIWVHWVVYNIDPSVFSIEENTLPKGGIEVLNDFGRKSYGGPCPPTGPHHYYFKLYAINKMLEVDSLATKEDVEMAMQDSILEKVELVGTYQRQEINEKYVEKK